MRNYLVLTRREMFSLMVSPLAYGAAAVFLFITGMVSVGQFTRTQMADPRNVLDPLGFILPVLFAPLLTMRLLAEERRQGTLEMLLTAPVRDSEVVLAKFTGVFVFYAGLTLLTLLHVFAMQVYYEGPFDWGRCASGYLGVLLIAALFLSFGLFVSSLFENPALAALTAFILGLAVLMAGVLTSSPVFLHGGIRKDIFNFLLPLQHYRNFLLGIVDTRDLCYFLSLTIYFLFLGTKVLGSRKWR